MTADSANTVHVPSLGTEVAARCATVAQIAQKNTGLTKMAKEVTEALTHNHAPTAALVLLHKVQRLYLADALGFADHAVVTAALEDPRFVWWDNYNVLPARVDQYEALAKNLFEGDPLWQTPILMILSDYGRHVGELLLQRCVRDKAEVDPWIEDNMFHRVMMAHLDADGAAKYADIKADRRDRAKRIVTLQSNTNLDGVDCPPVDEAIAKIFSTTLAQRRRDRGEMFYTLTTVPTPDDAVLDNIPYDSYVDLFFNMCAVDWDRVNDAHKILIEKLNAGSQLHITNSDGTDLRMDIGGFTFANSRVAKNVPGSEVFSAPHRDSVNGIVIAKGRFLPKMANEIVENITLEFTDGRLTRYDAEIGLAILKSVIELDEGSHWVGEIGIGTNPVLKQHLVNSLLVEKIGGSFHIALGNAYSFKDYLGEPVHVDNGNRSMLHWDITTMLHGKQGMMILDGEIIMADGKFVDPRLAYLNGAA